jgi:hypothetical protein
MSGHPIKTAGFKTITHGELRGLYLPVAALGNSDAFISRSVKPLQNHRIQVLDEKISSILMA